VHLLDSDMAASFFHRYVKIRHYPARGVALLLLGLVLLGLTTNRSFAQSSLDLQVYFPDVQILFLSDLGLVSREWDKDALARGLELFNFSVSSTRYPITVQFEYKISSRKLGLIAEGTSRPVTLREDVTGLTDFDLTTRGGPFELRDFNLVLDEEEVKENLAGGVLPADRYRFELSVFEVDDPTNRSDYAKEMDLTNPTTLNLRSPGIDPSQVIDCTRQIPSPSRPPYNSGLGLVSPLDEPDGYVSIEDWLKDGRAVLHTTEPVFYWDSYATDFTLTIWEKTDDLIQQKASVEEVLQTTPFFRQDGITANVFQFPASGGGRGPLREGAIYYYQVEAHIPSSRGEYKVVSPVYGFCIADLGIQALDLEGRGPGKAYVPGLTKYLDIIRELSGIDFSDSLKNWSPTGVITIDGGAVSLEELQKLVGKVKVRKVIVE